MLPIADRMIQRYNVVEEIETLLRQRITEAVIAHPHSPGAAAEYIGLTRRQLLYHMEQLGVTRQMVLGAPTPVTRYPPNLTTIPKRTRSGDNRRIAVQVNVTVED